MNSLQIILLILGGFIGLPVVAYMVVKFGAAGFFRAKRRHSSFLQRETKQTKEQKHE